MYVVYHNEHGARRSGHELVREDGASVVKHGHRVVDADIIARRETLALLGQAVREHVEAGCSRCERASAMWQWICWAGGDAYKRIPCPRCGLLDDKNFGQHVRRMRGGEEWSVCAECARKITDTTVRTTSKEEP